MTVSGTPAARTAADGEAQSPPGAAQPSARGPQSQAADQATARNSTQVTLPVRGQEA